MDLGLTQSNITSLDWGSTLAVRHPSSPWNKFGKVAQTATMRGWRYSSTKEGWFAIITVIIAIVTSLVTFELGLRLFPPTWLRSTMEFLAVHRGEVTFGADGFPRRTQNGGFWGFEANSEF